MDVYLQRNYRGLHRFYRGRKHYQAVADSIICAYFSHGVAQRVDSGAQHRHFSNCADHRWQAARADCAAQHSRVCSGNHQSNLGRADTGNHLRQVPRHATNGFQPDSGHVLSDADHLDAANHLCSRQQLFVRP